MNLDVEYGRINYMIRNRDAFTREEWQEAIYKFPNDKQFIAHKIARKAKAIFMDCQSEEEVNEAYNMLQRVLFDNEYDFVLSQIDPLRVTATIYVRGLEHRQSSTTIRTQTATRIPATNANPIMYIIGISKKALKHIIIPLIVGLITTIVGVYLAFHPEFFRENSAKTKTKIDTTHRTPKDTIKAVLIKSDSVRKK